MNLLITGASGFLGRNIIPIIKKDINILTLGLSDSESFKFDLAYQIPIFNEHFDVVLHAAGKAHSVPKTIREKEDFFRVNFNGTVNLCKALEKSKLPKSFIFISSVAVYGKEEGIQISEEHPLLGETPYALSKIKAETFLIDWCNKNNVTLTILRPSLIAGPNPPGNLGSMIRGIKTGKYLSIDNGKAQKSILMVQDIASLIPYLINAGGIFNVCDNEHPSFRDLEILISKQLNMSLPKSVPLNFAKIIAKIGDLLGDFAPINSDKLNKITKSLTFSNEKIKKELNWEPTNVIKNFKISN